MRAYQPRYYPSTVTGQAHTQRLLEVDLVSGAIALAAYARDGVPAYVSAEGGAEDPKDLLFRVFSAVKPEHLSQTAGRCWRAARRVFTMNKGTRLSWPLLLAAVPPAYRPECNAFATYAQEYGLGIAYYTPIRAAQLLELAVAREAYEQAQREQTTALEAMTDVLR